MDKFEEKVLLHSLDVINGSETLINEFNATRFTFQHELLKACVSENIIKEEVIEHIKRIAPLHVKIGDNVFLVGNKTEKEFDFIGDDMDYQKAYELYDITTEMETCDSYTFYVSSLHFFPFASVEESVMCIKFLRSL